MIDLHLMHASPEMLQAGYMLPKIPQPIPIICRLKPKMKEEMREMEEKGAKEEKGTNPENKALAAKIFIFYQFYYFFFITDFLYFFIIIFFIISILLVILLPILLFFLIVFFYYLFLLAYIIYFLLSILINKIRLNENKFDYVAVL